MNYRFLHYESFKVPLVSSPPVFFLFEPPNAGNGYTALENKEMLPRFFHLRKVYMYRSRIENAAACTIKP